MSIDAIFSRTRPDTKTKVIYVVYNECVLAKGIYETASDVPEEERF